MTYFIGNEQKKFKFQGYTRVLAAVKNSAVNTVFPIRSITELPDICFPNTR